MHGLVTIDERQDTADELVAFEVGELAKLLPWAEVGCIVGVAAGAAQRAFLGDFDRKRRNPASEDSSPGTECLRFLHTFSADGIRNGSTTRCVRRPAMRCKGIDRAPGRSGTRFSADCH